LLLQDYSLTLLCSFIYVIVVFRLGQLSYSDEWKEVLEKAPRVSKWIATMKKHEWHDEVMGTVFQVMGVKK